MWNTWEFQINYETWLDSILIQWTWTCVNSGRWWGTGRPGVLQSMRLQSQTCWTTTTNVTGEKRCLQTLRKLVCLLTSNGTLRAPLEYSISNYQCVQPETKFFQVLIHKLKYVAECEMAFLCKLRNIAEDEFLLSSVICKCSCWHFRIFLQDSYGYTCWSASLWYRSLCRVCWNNMIWPNSAQHF